MDVLEDGSLDLPDAVLGGSTSWLPRSTASSAHAREQTERILRAMDHPQLTVLAHPTGRLIGERESFDVDMLQVVRKAKRRGVHLEVNAQPARLDLADAHCRMCKDEGVLVAINSDAHSAQGFAVLRYGIGQARRGWLEAADVLNTRPLAALLPLLPRGASLTIAATAPADLAERDAHAALD